MEYKSKCRFPLLIALEGEIRQIRPGEIVVISESISHPYLELITIPIKKKVKKETSASEKSNTKKVKKVKEPLGEIESDGA